MSHRKLSKRRNKRYWSYIHNIADLQKESNTFTNYKDIRARVKFVTQQRHERAERFDFLRNNIRDMTRRVLTQGEYDVLQTYRQEFEIDFGYPEGESP